MGFVPQNITGLANRHIWEFLRYYLNLKNDPKYAVFIDGPWGSGKTHLVNQIITDHFRGWRDDYVKISLFGLGSTAEIDEAVFSAIYPMLNSPGAHVVGGIMKAGLSYLSASTEVRLQKLLSNKKAKVYIFDDLERCELEVSKVLGYINNFVEHSGARVIIIGDQSRLDVRQCPENIVRYQSEREKLIGRTLAVNSSFSEALESFVKKMNFEAAKQFVLEESDLVESVFHQSQTYNLRLLQLTLWDFERIFEVLHQHHRDHGAAMRALASLFFALSYEVKRGRLTEPELSTRDNGLSAAFRRRLSTNQKEPPTNMELAVQQYPQIDLRDELLPNNVLVDILFRGSIDTIKICRAIDRSRFFTQQIDQPTWLQMVNVLNLTDEEFEHALNKIERQLYAREIVEIGEILHIFSQRLWLARHKMIDCNISDVVKDSIDYIDALYSEEKLIPPNSDLVFRFIGHAGYGFSEAESPEFTAITRHVQTRLEQAKIDRYHTQAATLLSELEVDPDLFVRRITFTNSADNIFPRIPLLAKTNPHTFVELVLRRSPAQQQIIMRALQNRYQFEAVRDNELKPELPWLADVKACFIEEAEKLPRLSRQRVKLLVEWTLSAALGGDTDV